MSRLHICNTFFERELEAPESRKSLKDWIRAHPVFLQLQFLPLLYAAPEDKILVSDLPPNPDPRLCLIDKPPICQSIELWGPSLTVHGWAETHHIPYTRPNWELMRTLNSKIFSFTQAPKLPHAELLETAKEIETWINKTPGPKVLKTPFGTAGRGHILNPGVKQLYTAPLLGEPWVPRILDFSTQWKNGELLGVTLFENDPRGTYKGTFQGNIEPWALEEHLAVAKPLVENIKKMGYEDHIGIDSFIYLWEGGKRVHPIVEINARKTMSWVFLQTKKKGLFYTPSKEGLLPSEIKIQDKTIRFPRNITYI